VIPVGLGGRLRPRGGRTNPPLEPRLRARALALAAAVAVAAWSTGVSHADGDPASDTLLTQNVYFPYRSPSQAVQAGLDRAVNEVYARGDRVKVALIYEAADLGSIPSLFGNAGDYARFLGVELGLWYVGPLLVVMPAGFGVYDGGRSTASEEELLSSLRVDGSSPDSLALSATAALQRLGAADAFASPDIRAPFVTAHPAFARRGRPATLRFDVFDDSGRSKAFLRVYENRVLLATLVSPAQFDIGTRSVAVRWQVPATLRSRRLRFCVVAVDPAGNRSAPTCAPFLRVS
jgi:hypothetical protein